MILSRGKPAILIALASLVLVLLQSPAFAVPTVLSVDPTEGNQGRPALPFKVFGLGFMPGAQVFFENPGVHVNGPVTFISTTELNLLIDIDISAALGPGDVFVINPDFAQDALEDGFTVIPPEPPTITSIDPISGFTGDTDLHVTIYGDLLYTVIDVDFGAGITLNSIINVAADQIECIITIDWLATPGFRTVTVQSPYGSDQLPDAFEILAYPPPFLAGVIPDIGIQGETGKQLVITGNGFHDGLDFEFLPLGNIDVVNVQYNNPFGATVLVNIHADALVQFYDVRIINPDNQDYVLASAFRVRPPDPIIDSVDPDHGYLLDMSLPVVIHGSNLAPMDTADFGAGITVHFTAATSTAIFVELDIDISAPLGPHDVKVSNPELQATLPDGFTVLEPPPVINQVTPSQAERGTQNLPVTITGDWLDVATSLDFGPGISAIIQSAQMNQVSAILDIQPDAPVGFRNVTVFGLNGQDTLNNGFEVLPGAPSIDSVVPDQGERGAVGLPVAITGSNLDFIDTVSFGAGITVSILNAGLNQIDLELDIDPAAVLGFRDVTVSGSNGQDTLQAGFQVIPSSPHIDSVDPDTAVRGVTGLPVTITGTGLDLVDTVSFGPGITVSIVSISLFEIDVLIDIDPGADPGPRDVTVSGISGSDTLENGFMVQLVQPEITSVVPSQGNRGDQNLPVVVYGVNLQYVDTVTFGAGITVTVMNVAADRVDVELDIDPLATSGFRDVSVFDPYSQDTLPNGFEVLSGAPLIESIDPTEGEQGVLNLPVLISGIGLDVVDSVSFGDGIVATLVDVSYHEVNVLVTIDPAAEPGLRDVTVFGPDGENSLESGFNVLIRPIQLTEANPDQGLQGQAGLPVVIFGTGLDTADSVSFGSGITASVQHVEYDRVDVLLDIDVGAAPGPRDVTVTNPWTLATLIGGFQVLALPPEILSIDPNTALQGASGLDVTIHGNGFVDGASVDMGQGISIDSLLVSDPQTINLVISISPDAALGPRDVSVTNPDLQSDTLMGGFLVTAVPIIPPDVTGIDPSYAYQGDIGVQVSVTGTGFQPGVLVQFVNSGIDLTSVVFVDDTHLELFLNVDPQAPIGAGDVVFINPDLGEDIVPDGFEVRESIQIEQIVPNQATQGDTIGFAIFGAGFEPGVTVSLEPAGAFDILLDSVSSNSITGSLTVHDDAEVRLYDVRVENPGGRNAVLADGFEVLERIIVYPPPEVDSIDPTELCIGETGVPVTIEGLNFREGLRVEFEFGGIPAEAIYDVVILFIDSTTLRVNISVRDDAIEGLYAIRVTNPDGQFAFAPDLMVVDCERVGNLIWQQGSLDALVEVRSGSARLVQHGSSATLLNAGDGPYENVVVTMTDLTGDSGGIITPENVEIFPSIPGPMAARESRNIQVTFMIPVGGDLLPPGETHTFTGNMIAMDTLTGDRAVLPVTITVVVPQLETIEIDPRCFQLSLYRPGVPASQVLQIFQPDPGNAALEEALTIMGGSEEPFPVFEWAINADGCPGYGETWTASYTLTIYPVYPAQSPEEAVDNPPVWRAVNLDDTSIEYPANAEPLSGFYVWQVSVVPVALPESGVMIGSLGPFNSEIWAFCVGEVGFVVEAPEQPDLIWIPPGILTTRKASATASLVISPVLASTIEQGDSFDFVVTDVGTNQSETFTIDFSTVEFAPSSPVPGFGAAAIQIDLIVLDDVIPDRSVLQIRSGDSYFSQFDLPDNFSGSLEIKAVIGDNEAKLLMVVIS
jgi:hypothetical protein